MKSDKIHHPVLKAQDFVHLVWKMREAQEAYRANRNIGTLGTAREWESRVDLEIVKQLDYSNPHCSTHSHTHTHTHSYISEASQKPLRGMESEEEEVERRR